VVGEVAELGAEPTAKVQDAPRYAKPAVVERSEELGWRRGAVPEPVDVRLVLLVEDARG
jgi:hypothetical protein